jgi:hypothetical protein
MALHDEEVRTQRLLKFLDKDKKVDHGRSNTN